MIKIEGVKKKVVHTRLRKIMLLRASGKKAVIFDLDGTLINSIPFHFGEHKEIFKRLGVNLELEFFEKKCNGTKPDEFYKTILLHYTGSLRLYKKAILLKEKVFAHESYKGIKTFPGVRGLLDKLTDSGYVLALASSSGEKYIAKNLANNKLKKYFHVIVGSSHIKYTKPNPFIFNLAQKELGIPKESCVIVEDSINGVIAARRAHIDCICLLTSEKRKDVPKFAVIAKSHKKIYDIIKKM